MSTYTPLTPDVRFAYRRYEHERDIRREMSGGGGPLDAAEYEGEFDRWLATVRANVWRQCVDHLEPALDAGIKRAAHADNPWRSP